MSISRRTLLGAGAAGVTGGLLGFPRLRPGARAELARAKNVVFCVVDGMPLSIFTMADHFRQLTEGKRSYWSELMDREDVFNGLQDTRSLSSVVTDSSAASSTWGCGRRIWNGQVNVYPDGTKLRTVHSLMREAGIRTGLVTTATITHATPAGFAVNCIQRDLEALIAEEYLKEGVDVLMGGGDKFFSPAIRKDKRDLYADFRARGYKVLKSRADTLGAKSQKILGVYSNGHMPYTIDRDHDLELQKGTPTLAEMTTVALDNLRTSPKGFLLQVEGARVDHGGHSVDLAAMIYDQIAFEEALRVVCDFAAEDGQTLVIVTADHATGGPSLNGSGDEYFASTAGLRTVAKMKSSYAPLLGDFGPAPTVDKVREAVDARMGIQLTAGEAGIVADAAAGKSPFAGSEFQKSLNWAVATVLGNHTKVGWTSRNHTNDHVLVSAFGPGAESLEGLTQNVEMFDLMLGVKGLKWSNPTMSFEDAAKHYEKLVPIPPSTQRRGQLAELYARYGADEEDRACYG